MKERNLLIAAKVAIAVLATLAVIVFFAELRTDRDDARYFGSAAVAVFVVYLVLARWGRRR